MSDFYPAFSATCFVVLSLWLTTVVTRFGEWRNDSAQQVRAFGVGLFFSLPGIMTLVPLVDPASSRLWELAYTIVALGGAVVVAMLYRSVRDRVTALAFPIAIALYLAIGVIAIIGMSQHVAHVENRVDQVLMCALLFLGVNVVWWLIFAGSQDPAKAGGTGGAAAGHPAAAAD
jgi:hypothetical protein